jgi:predicted CXXCH cytochrome family protein
MTISKNKISLVLKIIILIFFISSNIHGQNEDCFDCHTDETLSLIRADREVSLFVSEGKFSSSIHADLECVECHDGFSAEDIPHRDGENIFKVDCSSCHEIEDFEKGIHSKSTECFECHSKHEIQEASSLADKDVEFCTKCHSGKPAKEYKQSVHYTKMLGGKNSPTCSGCHGESAHSIGKAKLDEQSLHDLCASCHTDQVSQFENSLHGLALAKGKFLAPNCITCHGVHGVLSTKDENSKTYKMNIPALCGDCHKDGTKVSDLKSIDERHILANYSLSIHGDGLFNKGLLATAVCTDCHFSHNILPHEDPKSSINRKNIAATCTQCHVQIEKVHTKVIKGELWEKEPHKIPACVDCHRPHEIRKVFYVENFTDEQCMTCHKKEDLSKIENGKTKSLYVDILEHKSSAHKDNSCVKCHTNVSFTNNPVCLNSGKVDCASCHAEQVDQYQLSTHGKLVNSGNVNAPYCNDCHGIHGVKKKTDLTSLTFSRNIPELCGKCHREGEKAAETYEGKEHEIIKNYSMSIHGKGLLKSGLLVTATCISCHTSHRELPASDTLSAVHDNNIAETCATCHLGIYEQFKTSIHSPEVTKTDKELPNCKDCHRSHTINRVVEDEFRENIMDQCGRCHTEVTETYFDTFHGKVSKLGSVKTAKCHDCHGSHNILPTFNPRSTLSRQNAVETCKTCHPNSNRKFVGYLTHATHHDKEKYPFLYYTFWAMTILLVSTFTFFGLHTLMWLPRALAEKRKHKKGDKQKNG